jgi:hypothetical protein
MMSLPFNDKGSSPPTSPPTKTKTPSSNAIGDHQSQDFGRDR